MKPSGIGGQAVIEGIMMRNKEKYSIAVRKPDNEIEVITKQNILLTEKHKFLNFPVIRGVFNFVDSLVTGFSTITYSAQFYEDPAEQKTTPVDDIAKAVFKDKLESVLMAVTILLSILFAIVLFMLTPYFVSRLLSKYIVSSWVLNLIEGLIRVLIFLLYIIFISLMKDIKRVFMYHGAEHKCINCIENGKELNVENVRASSRLHKRCGTSFLFFVMFVSIVFFIFIRVNNPFWQIAIRILLVPVIAGVSYEVIRWAGKSDNAVVSILSTPGMWLQKLTTKEPEDDMIEVAIVAVEAVFDWKGFLSEFCQSDENKNVQDENIQNENVQGQSAQDEAVQNESVQSNPDDIRSESDNESVLPASEALSEGEDNSEVSADSENVVNAGFTESEESDFESAEEDDDDDFAGFEMLDTDDETDYIEGIDDTPEKYDNVKTDETENSLGFDDSYNGSMEESEEDDFEYYGISEEDNPDNSDGIEFISEDVDVEEDYEELPIFKQRKTDIKR